MLSLLRRIEKLKGRFYSSSTQPFPILKNYLELQNYDLTVAKEKSQKLIDELEHINTLCYKGGGERGYNLHVKKNKKVLPRERVASLFDNDEDKLEICLQAGVGMEYGDIFGATGIAAIGKIRGTYCMVFASDATLKAGTSFPISVQKFQRTSMISTQCRLPRIALIDSGGAFLPLQSEIFPDKEHGGRQFYNLAADSALGIPTFTLVCGSCTAGGAYIPKMSEEAAIVDKIGTVYLAGPPLVKAALGEDVTHEDLGGATLHCSISGGTDYFCPTENYAFDVIKDFASTVKLKSSDELLPDNDSIYSSEHLNVLCGLDELDRDILYGVIARLADGSRFREFKQDYGQNLVAGFSTIGRERIGIIGNCGPISYKDGLKGAHFIQLCEHRKLPIIFLQNSGLEEKQEAFLAPLTAEEKGMTLKARASMAASLACSKVFKVAINIGGCHNDEQYTMCGPSFSPNFNFAWPGTSYSHSLHSRFDQSEQDELQNSSTNKKKRSKSAFNFEPQSCWFWSSRTLNDGIILPSATRKVLLKCIQIHQQRQRMAELNKSFPVIRF